MIQQNLYSAKIEQNDETIEEQKFAEMLQNKYAPLPFSARWRIPYLSVCVLVYVLGSYTFLVEFFALVFGMYLHYPTINTIIIAGIFGIGIGVLIEVMKRKLNIMYFMDGMLTKKYKPSIFGLMFLCAASSTLISFWGGLNIPTAINAQPLTINADTVNVYALQSRFVSDISLLTNSKNTILQNAARWKGKFGKETVSSIAEIDKAVIKMTTEKNQAISQANQDNKKAISQANQANQANQDNQVSQNEDLGLFFAVIALVIESLLIFLYYLKEKYLYKSALERTNIIKMKQGSITMPPPFIPASTTTPPHQPIITDTARIIVHGFQQNEPQGYVQDPIQDPIQDQVQRENVVVQYVPVDMERIVEIERIVEVEKPVYVQTKEVVVIDGNFQHQKTDGTSVGMTLAQCQSRVKQYQKSLDEAAAKKDSGDSKADWGTIWTEREKTLEYWENAVKSFTDEN